MNTRLNDLIASLLPDDAKKLLDTYGATLLDTLMTATLEVLPSNRIGEFERIVKEGTPEEFDAFIHEAVPNIDELLAAEIQRFSQETNDLLESLGVNE